MLWVYFRDPNCPAPRFSRQQGLCQEDYPYPVGGRPGWPVNATCSALVTALDADSGDGAALVAAAAAATKMALGYGADGECLATFEEGPGGVPGDGPGPDAWGYQSCTETLHEFSSRAPPEGLRAFAFDLNTTGVQACGQLFDGLVTPDTGYLARRFGGYLLGDGLAAVTNIVWSNGLLDPWSGGGFYAPRGTLPLAEAAVQSAEGGAARAAAAAAAGVGIESGLGAWADARRGTFWLSLPSGAHHLDLRAPDPADPSDVTAARAVEEAAVLSWVGAFAAKDAELQKGLH